MNLNKVVFGVFAALPLAVCVVACGDDVTNNVATGLTTVGEGEDLPSCSKENVGEMVFITDSAAVFYCIDGKWQTLKGANGKDGENGKDGVNGSMIPSIKYDCAKYNCVTTAYLNPAIEYGELLDERDNRVYRTVQIGEQVWMAQNLAYEDPKDVVLQGQMWCYYDSTAFCETFGRLYTWSAVMG